MLLAALLNGMDAALCAFDAEGVVTHWNREAERILGWTRADAVGRAGLAGWAVRPADADEVETRLLRPPGGAGRRVHEFALLTKSGGRVLVRTQATGMVAADGSSRGVYCAFSEVHAQVGLERSLALSEALLDDACWGAVLVDADLRPAVVNSYAARAFQRATRAELLGRPLGDVVEQGVEELEGALQHVLGQGATPAPAEIWVTLREATPPETPGPPGSAATRTDEGSGPASGGRAGQGGGSGGGPGKRGTAAVRRCWRSGFLRLDSPMAEEPVPLGVAWLFQDVTESKRAEQDAARLRFRGSQLHRAARASAECESPMEAAAVQLDFALVGFADHALLDLADPREGWPRDAGAGSDAAPRLLRAATAPVSSPGRVPPVEPSLASGIPVGYGEGHPAVQAYLRCGAVRASAGGPAPASWAAERRWPDGTAHALCTVLRARGRSLGIATFLRGASRAPFDRADAAYAEEVALRVAGAIDLAYAIR
nr:PAS domain-containing protein [Streptomyces sp. AJS327]